MSCCFLGGFFGLKKKKKSFYTQHTMVAPSDKIVKIGKVGKIEQLVIHDDQIKASLWITYSLDQREWIAQFVL